PETPPHIRRDERYRTPDPRKYYEDLANTSRNSNEVTNNQTRGYRFDRASQHELNIIPVQTQSVQRRPRKAHNLARSIIDNFNPIIISGKNVISGRHMLQRMSISPLCSAPVSILRLLTENSPITGEPYLKQIRFLLADIQHDLHMHNPFAQVFCSTSQFVREGQLVVLKILSGQGNDIQHYNWPTANEVAVLMINDSTTNSGPLTEDFIYAAQQLGQNTIPEDPLIVSCTLLEIEDHIRQCGKNLEDFPELPTINYDLLNYNRQIQLFIEETTFPQDKLQQILEGVSLLNDEQHAIYDAVVVTDSCPGSRVFISRIVLEPSNTELPFKLQRRQFPIKLAFALTINKAQGQTIPNLGLYLPEPVFTHGQLYVALSR
ncbi:15090_t:CDS:2, partial [Gigaspora margarita]